MKVQNYSSIDENVLNIEIKEYEKDSRNLKIDKWKVIMMEATLF